MASYYYADEDLAEDHARELSEDRLATRYGEVESVIRKRYLNEYGYREVLHTAHILQENVECYLCEHPAVFFDEEAYRLAWVARQTLFDLYQRLGKLEYDVGEKDESP